MKPIKQDNREIKILYRYEISYKSYDDETDVVLKEYPVLRETDFCYFINPQIIGIPKEAKKRVLKLEKFNNGYQQTGEYTKRFAYINKSDAKLNFIKRTQRRIAWYDFWKEECEKGLKIIKSL